MYVISHSYVQLINNFSPDFYNPSKAMDYEYDFTSGLMMDGTAIDPEYLSNICLENGYILNIHAPDRMGLRRISLDTCTDNSNQNTTEISSPVNAEQTTISGTATNSWITLSYPDRFADIRNPDFSIQKLVNLYKPYLAEDKEPIFKFVTEENQQCGIPDNPDDSYIVALDAMSGVGPMPENKYVSLFQYKEEVVSKLRTIKKSDHAIRCFNQNVGEVYDKVLLIPSKDQSVIYTALALWLEGLVQKRNLQPGINKTAFPDDRFDSFLDAVRINAGIIKLDDAIREYNAKEQQVSSFHHQLQRALSAQKSAVTSLEEITSKTGIVDSHNLASWYKARQKEIDDLKIGYSLGIKNNSLSISVPSYRIKDSQNEDRSSIPFNLYITFSDKCFNISFQDIDQFTHPAIAGRVLVNPDAHVAFIQYIENGNFLEGIQMLHAYLSSTAPGTKEFSRVDLLPKAA